jgi:hypothetical protein
LNPRDTRPDVALPAHARSTGRAARLLSLLLVAVVFQGLLSPLAKAASAAPAGLLFSTTSNRANPNALDGASVSGKIYVFTARTTDVKQVLFYVDDPARARAPYNRELRAPFDLGGSTNGLHNGYDTAKLRNGPHTFTAAITLTSGSVEIITAVVTTLNAVSVPLPSSGLVYSRTPNRANPVPLDGATVSGKVFASTKRTADVKQVQFYVDDPARARAPYNIESSAPFDLGGATNGLHNGYDTAKLGNGPHTFTAAITLTSGSVEVITATPTVANTTPAPAPTTPAPTPTPTPIPVPSVDGRLGLHVTNQELAAWRQRAASGPYKSSGDAGRYSPGDWDRVVANKNAFMSNPAGEVFTMPGSGCITQDSPRPEIYLDKIRDAAFYALVMQDAKVGAAVRDQLLKQVSAVNFADTSRWCASGQGGRKDTDPAFGLSHRLTKLLFAYDYVRILGVVPAADQAKIESWHRAAASWEAINVRLQIAKANGITGNFDGWSGRESTGYDGGPQIGERAKQYNNRIGAVARYVGLAGVALRDRSLTATGADFYKKCDGTFASSSSVCRYAP